MSDCWVYIPAPRDPKGGIAWLNLNQRLHWAPKSDRVRQWRLLSRHAAEKVGLPKQLERVRIVAYIHRTDNRSYDCHNYLPTAKAIVDGLVDYGLLPDDNNDHLSGPDMRPGETRPEAGVTLTIQDLTHDPG